MPASTRDRDERRAAEAQRQERADQERRDHEMDVADAYRRMGWTEDDGTGVSDFDQGSADIPIWGWLSGAQARRDAARNREDQLAAQGTWGGLATTQPSVYDLTADYLGEGNQDEYGDLIGGPSAFQNASEGGQMQRQAMEALQNLYQSGGVMEGDRAASRAMRDQQAQQLGAANQAALQNMQARGMGGSGAELAMRMQAGDTMARANAQG